MLAKEESLVARVDDDRIGAQSRGIKEVKEPSDVVVHGRDATKVILDVALVFPPQKSVAGQRLLFAVDFDGEFHGHIRQPLLAIRALEFSRGSEFQVTIIEMT